MASDDIILIAERRSGTQLLTSLIDSHPEIGGYGEMFMAAYWKWRMKLITQRPELSVPTRPNQRYLFDLYLRKLKLKLGKPRVLVNVKYNHLHAIDTPARRHESMPQLVNHVRDAGMPVFHLVRRSGLEAIVSLYRWEATGVATSTGSEPPVSINVDPPRACKDLGRLSREIDYVDKCFRGHPHFMKLFYEDLVMTPEAELAKIGEFLGVDPSLFSLSSDLQKISRPLPEMVLNWVELSAAVKALQHPQATPNLRHRLLSWRLAWRSRTHPRP